jgi:metal-responsive CopG/Arc/MetJ family transcriptional regulator
MAEEKEDRVFVNTPMESDLVEKLDKMVEETESTRAQFIRLLIKKQWNEFEHLGIVKSRVFKGRIPQK